MAERNKFITTLAALACIVVIAGFTVSACSDKDKATWAAVGRFIASSCMTETMTTGHCYREGVMKLDKLGYFAYKIDLTRTSAPKGMVVVIGE